MPHNKMSNKITECLKELEAVLPDETRAKICIPNGIVRTVDELMPEYSFIQDQTVRRNICYAVEALDFYRWIINRFMIYGPVSGYLYKTGIILTDMIVESMTRDFIKQNGVIAAKKYSKNIPKLPPLGVPNALCERMVKLHQRRSNIHLYLVTDLEATKYNLKDWNLSILCLRAVRKKFTEIMNRAS